MQELIRCGALASVPPHYIIRNGANYFGCNDRPVSLEFLARNFCIRSEAEATAAALGAGWSVELMRQPAAFSEAA